jgi:hypothetical protein
MSPRCVRSVRVLALLEHAEAQEVEACSAVHLALNEFETVDLSFDVALAPWQSKSFADGVYVSFEASGEACQRGTTCGFQPCHASRLCSRNIRKKRMGSSATWPISGEFRYIAARRSFAEGAALSISHTNCRSEAQRAGRCGGFAPLVR